MLFMKTTVVTGWICKRKLMSAVFAVLCLSSFADVAWTDVETVTDYLTNTLPVAVSDVRVYTLDEAVPLVDRYFAPTPKEKCPDPARRLRRMKHLLENEFAFVYSFSTDAGGLRSEDEGDEENVSGDISVYVYQPRVFSWFDVMSNPPRVMIGLRGTDYADYVVLSKADGRRLDFFLRGIGDGKREGQLLPFKNRKLEADVSVPELGAMYDDNEPDIQEDAPEVIVVADTESVFFDSVRNMNPSCVKDVTPTSYALISPVATYRVELLVRRVEQGDFPYERLAFVVDPVNHRSLYKDWPFYRGMTLGVALCRIDGALRVRRVWPVLPYPPFSSRTRAFTDSLTHKYDPSRSSRFSLNTRAAGLKPDGAVSSLAVQYGEHTLAKFIARFNGIEGMYGKFPDYSCGVEVEVWTASEGANPDYWRDAWFASPGDDPWRSSNTNKFCTVQNAEEGLDDLSLLKFRWKPCRIDNRIRQVKTLGDFAEFLNAATVCVGCGQRHYKVSVDSSAAAREAKIPVLPHGVFGALEDVCEKTGCEFKVDGTNVVISAWLTDSEIADDSLQGRLRILEKVGFASVAGAQYAGVSFWRRDMRDGAARPIDDRPLSFSSFGDYGTTGNGWIRTTADGKSEALAFDSSWWPSDGGFYNLEKARLLRDIAKVCAYLRDAAESSDDLRYSSLREAESDRFALAFALHVLQAGYAEEAQSLFDALKLRPDAASAAFTSLLAKVSEAKKDYPDFKTWLEKSLDPREKNKKGSVDDDVDDDE